MKTVITELKCGANSKESACRCRRCRRCGFSPLFWKIPGEGNSNPLLYFCLETPMDRGAWQATVHGVAKSQTWLKWLRTLHCFHWKAEHTDSEALFTLLKISCVVSRYVRACLMYVGGLLSWLLNVRTFRKSALLNPVSTHTHTHTHYSSVIILSFCHDSDFTYTMRWVDTNISSFSGLVLKVASHFKWKWQKAHLAPVFCPEVSYQQRRPRENPPDFSPVPVEGLRKVTFAPGASRSCLARGLITVSRDQAGSSPGGTEGPLHKDCARRLNQ